MKRPVKKRDLVGAWLEKADKDLRLAELAVSQPDPPCDLISFHAQQCAEKYLEAALVWNGPFHAT
ncbi:MAG TPA: HEPN domain-containing protein [Bacteroidetes bacterium]|nr:HEPN domain-containing protein [Bacteroidota bacterium]